MRNCVKSPGNYGRSLSDMFGGMSLENKSVFGCPEAQQRCYSAEGECGDNVCRVKLTLTKDTVCIVRKEDKLTQKLKITSAKKRQTIYPKKERMNLPKNEDNLT